MRFNIKEICRKALGPSLRSRIGVINGVMTADPVCSLTFDDGPDPAWTPKVLQVLKQYHVRATFFMVGEGASAYPDIVEEVAREGHVIGNHSWNHPAFPLIPLAERWRQISKCQRAIQPYGFKLFRPPYGMSTRITNMEVILRGYKVIGWSHTSGDWCESDPRVVAANIVKGVRPGSIILLHDRIFDKGRPIIGPKNSIETVIDREPMLFALRELLGRVKGQIEFVTIPALLQHGNPQRL